MRYLTVLYDRECLICRKARYWLDQQPKHIPLRFMAAQSSDARLLYPTLADTLLDKFTVVSDEGAVYREDAGWIMCLYALKRYRRWAKRLAAPSRRGLVRLMVSRIGRNRLSLSKWLGRMLAAPPLMADKQATGPLFCDANGTCVTGGSSNAKAFVTRHVTAEPDANRTGRAVSTAAKARGEWFD